MHPPRAGQVIFRSVEGGRSLEVRDDSMQRYLHLDSDAVQSAMLLSDPTALALSYTRAMMSFLLFRDNPQRVLCVGLGGGSLPRFLRTHFPDCAIDIVENRADVIAVAERFFRVGADARIRIIHDDAGAYIDHVAATTPRCYDVVLADAYDGVGITPAAAETAFYSACRTILTQQGILVVNLWSSDKAAYRHCLAAIAEPFGRHLLQLPVAGKGNIIVLAAPAPLRLGNRLPLKERAAQFQARLGIEFNQFLRDLSQHNGSAWLRMMERLGI